MSTRQIVLNDAETQVPLRVRTNRCMSDDEYFEFCGANPDLRIERTPTGEIVIMAPTGGEAGYREGEVFGQLGIGLSATGGDDHSAQVPGSSFQTIRRYRPMQPGLKTLVCGHSAEIARESSFRSVQIFWWSSLLQVTGSMKFGKR